MTFLVVRFFSEADSRSLMLMMAMETLIEPQPRPLNVKKHVKKLIADTRLSCLPENEKDSLIGSFEWFYVV